MSWMDNLQDASFKGAKFDVIKTSDTGNKDISQYEYPYVAGGDVEDLGRKPRNCRMTAVIWGDTYESKLQALIEKFDELGAGELIHPVFGSMPNMIAVEYQVQHDAENVDYCTIELVFLECKTRQAFFKHQYPLAWADSIFNTAQSLLDDMSNLFDSVTKPLRQAKSMMNKSKALANTGLNLLTILKSDLNGFESALIDFVNYPKQFTNNLTALVDTQSKRNKNTNFVATGTYRPANPTNQTNQLNVTQSTSSTAKKVDIDTVNVAMSDWGESKKHLLDIVAIPDDLATGRITPPLVMPINVQRNAVILLTVLVRFVVSIQLANDAAELFSDEALTKMLSPTEIETVTGDVREVIQQVIDEQREFFGEEQQTISVTARPESIGVLWQPVVENLKNISIQLQNLAQALILTRPPLVTRTIRSDTNLHLLAHHYYQDYSRAHELLRLNPRIRNPNNIKAGEVIYAYAE